jgi:glycerol-3-phosphate cytidylyltransferase
MAVVYTGGTFDLIHPGHISLLRRCYDLSGEIGKVVVALNTDEFVEAYKGHRPVMSFNDRKAVLEAVRWVDEVVSNTHGHDSKPTIERIKPDIIAIGADWQTRDYYAQMQFTKAWLTERGIDLVYCPLLYAPAGAASFEPHSSTRLRRSIRE